MDNEERQALKAQLHQRCQLYQLLAAYLPSQAIYDMFPGTAEWNYSVKFIAEFRQELERRAYRAEIASQAIHIEPS